MSSINLCERNGCTSMMQGRAVGLVALVVSSEPDAQRIQLECCPGCVNDLVTLLNSAPTSNRQSAYRDPWKPPVDPESTEDSIAERFAERVARKMLRLEARKDD